MKLLKLILIIFAFYFVRRFIQLYKAMKQLQKRQLQAQAAEQAQRSAPARPDPSQVVDAEYKVLDS